MCEWTIARKHETKNDEKKERNNWRKNKIIAFNCKAMEL